MRRRPLKKSFARLAAVVSILVCPSVAEPRELLADYRITTWGPGSGLPSTAVTSIVQDLRGFLWVATPAGIVRFDGARFTPWSAMALLPLPAQPADKLMVSSTGILWIGFGGAGGVASLDDDIVQVYGEKESLPASPVRSMAETVDRTIWVGTAAGLYRRHEGRWQKVEIASASTQEITALHADRRGNLLVATPQGVFKRRESQNEFRLVAPFSNVQAFSESPSGEVWATDPVFAFRSVDNPQRPVPVWQRGIGSAIVEGRDGSRWVGTMGQGLWRIRVNPDGTYTPPEKATTRTGLPTDGVTCAFEDKSGNLWVGTSGVTRLVPYKITALTDMGLVRAVEPTRSAGVWVGTTDEVMKTFATDGEWSRDEKATESIGLGSMRMDERGSLWVAGAGELLRFDAGATTAPVLRTKIGLMQVSSVTSDFRGGLLLYEERTGFYRWRSGRLTTISLPAEVTEEGVSALFTDESGRIWIAFGRGRIAWMRCDTDCRVEDVTQPLTAGSYRTFYEDMTGVVWLGGTEGLTRFKDGRFETIDMRAAPRLASVLGIVEDDLGYLWVGTRLGIVRLMKSEFDLVLQDQTRQLRHTYFDRYDGVGGGVGSSTSPLPISDNRRAVKAGDGRLWFVTGRGVTIVDPSLLARDRPNAAVQISSIVVDDRFIPTGRPFSLPRPSRLAISYAVLDLTSPRQRYRYRLDGYDHAWVEADSREAVYTKLPAGFYRFIVEADTNEGTWSDAGAQFGFTLQPLFYETGWFATLMVGLVAIAIWMAWKVHLLQTRRQFRLVLAERARLSREIHDTLLQRLIGVMLQHDALAWEFSGNKPLSDRLTRMRQELQRHVREAREAIVDLRSPATMTADFVSALRNLGAEATAGHPITFTVRVEGEPYRSPASLQSEMLRICQEAVTNAVRHAWPKSIRALVQYGPDAIVLTIEDDGCGIDPVRFPGGDSGHYGVVGMRERADSLSAELTINSRDGQGTAVVITVPTRRTSLRGTQDV